MFFEILSIILTLSNIGSVFYVTPILYICISNFFKMKNLLYTLLLIPFAVFGQGQVDCSLLSVTDVVIQNDSITFEIFNADTMDTHYPYVSYTLDANGDTLQKGHMDYYMTFAETSSQYSYRNVWGYFVMDSLSESTINYPLSIYFTYSNLTGENSGDYTCELLYNPQMEIISPELISTKTLIKTIDVLGRDVSDRPYKILIDLYDDGSSHKRVIIE